jgi:hypothetical protein
MRLKHNKKRNTAFLYEALVRELTESVVKSKKNKQNKIVSIIKEHFSKNSLLGRELDLYKSIYETRHIEKRLAEKIVLEAKKKHLNLNKSHIFKEQSALIGKINKTLTNKVFKNFLPNYKSLASVYSIFNDNVPVKDRVLLEENLIDQMSSSVGTKIDERQKPIDNIIYGSFVNRFNEEYSHALSENQKVLLTKYISSFSDNGLELKVYLNEELWRLKTALTATKEGESVKQDPDAREKIEKVFSILEDFRDKKEIDLELLETVLKTQALVEEIEDVDKG